MSNGEVTTVGIPSLFGLTGTKQAFQDEGILLGDAQTINFVGDGVTATLAFGVLTVQIDGGAAAELVTTLGAVTETDTTHGVAASVVFELGTAFGGALTAKADLASPAFTDTPTAPTKSAEDATTALATTEFVHSISDLLVVDLANKAPLVDGLVPAIYLPSFVDDVLEFADLASFPVTGEAGKIYIAIDTALDYRWTGSVYSIIGQTPDVVGIGSNVFPRYDQAQVLTAPQKAQVKANIGLSDTDGLSEGVTNKYFTDAQAVAAVLTGYVVAVTNAVVAATDTVSVAIGKLQKQITDLAGSFRYSINAQTGTTYTVLNTDVNQYGNKILKCTNGSAIAVTLPTPATLGAVVGDSFNIRQGSVGGITITGTVSGANTTAAINTTITLIAESSTSWMNVGG